MSYGVLVDTTKCIGCRSCQVSCKQWNKLPAERTHIEGRITGNDNPVSLSANTFTLVTDKEVADPKAQGGLRRVFSKRQCMHCNEPACASACPVTALHKTESGPVLYDGGKCIGCRYCVWACPFGVPTAQWDSLAPAIRKCTLCFDRISQQSDIAELNGQPLSPEAKARHAAGAATPACVKACTTGALQFGKRDELIGKAWERARSAPDQYIQHVYGEKEVGGTAYLYLAGVSFDKAGFRSDLGTRSYPSYSKAALGYVPAAVLGMGGLLTAFHIFHERKARLMAQSTQTSEEGKE